MVVNRLQDRLLTNIAGVLPVVLLFAFSAEAAIKAGARYEGGSLTMEAKNATIPELLESIAKIAGIDIYVTKGFLPKGNLMTMDISGEPLEEVLKRVLHGYNYAAVYIKEGNDFRIAVLKIYLDGGQAQGIVPFFISKSSPIVPVRQDQTVTVVVNSGGDIVTRNNMLDQKGVLGPSDTEVSANSFAVIAPPSWLTTQLQLELDEAERFTKLLLLRKQAESATDPERKEALSLVYAEEMAKFEAFKRANLSKVEALKRINQFK